MQISPARCRRAHPLLLLICSLLLLHFFIPANLWAIGRPYLVKNINPNYDAIDNVAVKPFAVLGNNLIFSANDGTTGQELWKSDGTEAGTQLLVNIRPGLSWSSPENLTTVNSKVVFTANDGVNGKELWVTDGTSSGTQLLADIYLGTSSSTPQKFTPVGNILYVVAATVSGSKLWKTDGTPLGTMLASEFTPGYFSSIDSLSANGSKLLVVTFLSGATATWNLWSVDPVAGTTELIKTFLSQPKYLTPCNGTTFFSLNGGGYGEELWQTDGTDSGTYLLKDISPGNNSSYPGSLTCIGNTLFFTANDPAYGIELWTSDSTSAGTVMVKDIYGGATGASIDYLTELNGKLVFRANSPDTGSELWQSDGTTNGTTLLADITPGPNYSSPVPRFVTSNTLFLIANGVLWVTDGTAAGTKQLSDNTYPSNFNRIGNTVYFSASRSDVGNELWAISLELEPFTRIISPQSGSATNMSTINISGDALVDGETTVVLTEVSLDGGTTWAAASGTTSWNYSWMPAADGTYTIMARSTDSSSVTQATPAASSITVDRTPPGGWLTINSNATTTTATQITLEVTASAQDPGLTCEFFTPPYICGTLSIRFSNNGTAWSAWESAQTVRSWTLPTGDGNKTVYAQLKDRAGNTTEISDTIILDTSQVPVSVFTSPASGYATSAGSVTVTGTAAPGPGGGTVIMVEVSKDGGTTWLTTSGTTSWSITLSLPTAGSYTIKSRARTSSQVETPTSGITVTIDRTPPSGTLALYYGIWTLNATDGGICVALYPNICGSLEMSFNGVTWQPATTQPGIGGPLWLRDKAGNVSQIAAGSITNPYGGPIQISRNPSAYYSLVQHAYNVAMNGDLISLASDLTENLALASTIDLTIRGGYINGFGSAPSGTTSIIGNLSILAGTAAIENIDLTGALSVEGGSVSAVNLSVR